jgi:hypothetical protein
MSEWYDSQRKSNSDFRQLLQERMDKANPRRRITSIETKRLNRLEAIAARLKRRENVQNRQLQNWLIEDENAQIEAKQWSSWMANLHKVLLKSGCKVCIQLLCFYCK